jgi:hypothetical protein
VLTGTLRRQVQTWQGIAEGVALAGTPHTRLPGLDEYDSHAVIAAIHPEPLLPDTPERYRAHFRLLRQGLAAWMRGDTAPAGMLGYADFVQGVADALERARALGEGREGRVRWCPAAGPSRPRCRACCRRRPRSASS